MLVQADGCCGDGEGDDGERFFHGEEIMGCCWFR